MSEPREFCARCSALLTGRELGDGEPSPPPDAKWIEVTILAQEALHSIEASMYAMPPSQYQLMVLAINDIQKLWEPELERRKFVRSGAAQEVSPPAKCKNCRTILYRTLGEKGEYCDRCESGAAQEVSPEHILRNLLAVIHRDGGHYATEHGLEKAGDDAQALVLKERVEEVSPPSPEPGFDEATEARWQKAIYEACKKVLDHSLWHLIDGAGCDSGDALDFTLTEIRQTFNILQNPEAEGDTRELKAALKEMVWLNKSLQSKLVKSEDYNLIMERAEKLLG